MVLNMYRLNQSVSLAVHLVDKKKLTSCGYIQIFIRTLILLRQFHNIILITKHKILQFLSIILQM